jgi:hypothetical protein
MVRRLLCLGAVLLMLLSVQACSDKNKNKPKEVNDPDGNYTPKPAGGKAG